MNVLTVVALNQKCVTMNGLHLYCFVMLKLNHFQNKTKAIYFYTHFQKKNKNQMLYLRGKMFVQRSLGYK